MMMGVLISFWIGIGCLVALLFAFGFPRLRYFAGVVGVVATCGAELLLGPLPAPWGSALLTEMFLRVAAMALIPVLLAGLFGAWYRRWLER